MRKKKTSSKFSYTQNLARKSGLCNKTSKNFEMLLASTREFKKTKACNSSLKGKSSIT